MCYAIQKNHFAQRYNNNSYVKPEYSNKKHAGRSMVCVGLGISLLAHFVFFLAAYLATDRVKPYQIDSYFGAYPVMVESVAKTTHDESNNETSMPGLIWWELFYGGQPEWWLVSDADIDVPKLDVVASVRHNERIVNEYMNATSIKRWVNQIKLKNPEVTGALDKRIIQKVVRQHSGELRACYEKELNKNKGLNGRVVVNWIISPQGAVTKAIVKESTIKNKNVESCVVNSVKFWKFPAPKGGGIVAIEYPFVFEAGSTTN